MTVLVRKLKPHVTMSLSVVVRGIQPSKSTKLTGYPTHKVRNSTDNEAEFCQVERSTAGMESEKTIT